MLRPPPRLPAAFPTLVPERQPQQSAVPSHVKPEIRAARVRRREPSRRARGAREV
jgi:hypothetical protein